MNGTPLRSEDVREKNEKLILRYIQQSEGISQSELVQLTGLKAPTVLRIFSILEERGLIAAQKNIQDRGTSDKKGRKPVFYTVIPDAHYVIGVEFWSETAFVLVVDFSRKPIHSFEVCFHEGSDSKEVFLELTRLIEKAIKEAGLAPDKILGIGVGAPGQVSVDSGTILNYRRLPGFTDFPLGEMLEKKFNCPIIVANNAGVIALNSYRQGVAKDAEALFTFFVRRGVGGAFIHQGQLFTVLGKTAFEVGHTVVEFEGNPCYCGSRGCLETCISESAILDHMAAAGFSFTKMDEVEQRLSQGDAEVIQIVKNCEKYLTVSAKNIMRLLSPDGFLVITRYPTLSMIFADLIADMLKDDTSGKNVQVYHSEYSPREACLGACDLILDQYFQNT